MKAQNQKNKSLNESHVESFLKKRNQILTNNRTMCKKEVDVSIIGAGLTGLTLAYYLKRLGLSVAIVEKASTCGGTIRTKRESGFTYEIGPNTGTLGSTEVVELFDDLKGKVEIEIGNPKSKFRWIWKNGKWNILPINLTSAIKTPLFSMKDKLNILGEPFRKRGENKNETIAEMVKRRLGESYLDYAVNPFISGIYAGDPKNLITRFALPKLYNLEQNYGSFIKGAIRKRKEPKTELEKRVSKEVFSVRGGFDKLIKALEEEIGRKNIYLNSINTCVNVQGKGFVSHFFNPQGKRQEIYSKKVVSTTNGIHLQKMFPFISPQEVKFLTNTRYAKIIQVAACYTSWKGVPLNAFGGLVPSKEKRNCLGILFPSSIFKNRAPKGGAILSIFMGGINRPQLLDKSDEEIKQIALNEINESLQTHETPDVLEVFRYPEAIPQYEKNTQERLDAIVRVQKQFPGLYIAGKIRDGIGISDRIKQGKQLAEEIRNTIPSKHVRF